MGGYMGKMLRVDLTSGRITEESLPADIRRWIGGVGLGAKIVYDEVPPNVGSFDPENRMVITTGPLTGTTVPSSSDWTVTSLRAELGDRTIIGSHSHGYWGAFLKMNGYDGIIFQGAAARPTYMWVHDGKAELRDASKLWGKDTHDTEDAVLAEIPVPNTVVATIGPAGENLIGSASIENEKHHAASKGMGCIMGSKKLKAIAVTRGPYGVPISKPKEFLQAAKAWRDAVSGSGMYMAGFAKKGYAGFGDNYRAAGKNMGDPEWSRGYAYGMAKANSTQFVVNPKGCWACPISCSYRSVVTTGPHAGYVATLAGGGENQEGSAAMAGVSEPGTVQYLTDMVDRLGLDSAPIGCALGVAFEAYEKGILTKERTGGLELRWGNADAVEKLWRMAVNKEGFGEVLAEGPKKTAEYIGEEALDFVVHVKGVSPNLHDFRGTPQMILAQATSPAGPCWQSGTAQAIPLRTFVDSEGICSFAAAQAHPDNKTFTTQAIAAATGWDDFTPEEIVQIGERILSLQRVHAMRRGMTKADDFDIGARLLEPQGVGPNADKTIAPDLAEGIASFYEARGWDRETGKPLPATLRRLGLQNLLKDLP